MRTYNNASLWRDSDRRDPRDERERDRRRDDAPNERERPALSLKAKKAEVVRLERKVNDLMARIAEQERDDKRQE